MNAAMKSGFIHFRCALSNRCIHLSVGWVMGELYPRQKISPAVCRSSDGELHPLILLCDLTMNALTKSGFTQFRCALWNRCTHLSIAALVVELYPKPKKLASLRYPKGGEPTRLELLLQLLRTPTENCHRQFRCALSNRHFHLPIAGIVVVL